MVSRSAEVKRISPRENILLYGDNFIVGVGFVHSVDEAELCHGEIIGRDRISVQIYSSIRPDFILPYPSSGANIVGEAVNSFAIWDIPKIYPMPKLPQSQYQEPPEPTPNASTQVHADERESSSLERQRNVKPEDQLYFKVRKNWANVEVTLLSMLESLPIADGIIFLPFSTSSVEEVQVGEQYARECMRKVDKKDVLDERSFFYNEPYSRRVEYILSKFDHPGFADGYMLFMTLEVCKPNFWTLYGFVKQTFYNYEGAYKMGQRVGFHKNSGTFKPKDTSIFARACMKTFFQQTAEPLPHKESRNENTDGIIYRLPKVFSHDDVYKEIAGKMEAVGMTAISRVAFDSLWKKEFPNYGIHNSSAFVKCLLCVKFTTMLQPERRSAERAKLELDREKHLKHQMSGRKVYYSHIELSTSSPNLYLSKLSFIHDAMDLAKTVILRLCDKVKTLIGSVQTLPLKVIGILNHGHEPRVVAHVTVGGLWKSDPNYTITSIAKQLRDYKNFHTDKKLGDLHFTGQTSHLLFNAFMDEEIFNTTVLAKKYQSKEEFFQMDGADNSEVQASTRKLPPNLYIQLDNSAKYNKNWAMMAFCSELVARGYCKMITMSFLVVGHTHEDVDAFFSNVNAAQGGNDTESLPHFLAVVYLAQSSKAYP
ncbi:hypothetical protein R1sor_005597 [Riccia sorocarpa]|uniref:DUF7869 domain-containing protein n=1 Tax=Riccia sorocarpa TaxID=122646 RepID=A0ABD3HPA6_9MARC